MDYQKELLEKSSQGAQLLMSDLRELYRTLIDTNPLAAELFRTQVLEPAGNLLNTLKALDAIARREAFDASLVTLSVCS